ncbi:uncharacterized protein LOC132727312 [Ruditapes philippinarum]|uniref:uncharacterized protein LOC132727312 n=1 Tax=Ruditapes philippinarum TaxID=129788 RepID=UPI00295BF989|nr:uncharacterized protein LOC132727312 [Ruditapes philippinarum]XP_060568727.1 uncharacterized protein LOC132727312 [Ruditapes philippinarum]
MSLRKYKWLMKQQRYSILLVVTTTFIMYTFLWKFTVNSGVHDNSIYGQLKVSGNSTHRHVIPLTTQTVTKKHKEKGMCDQWFEDSFEKNLEHIARYPRGLADKYMYTIAENRSAPKTVFKTFPVVVTAADSGFYGISQGLIKSVYEKLLPKYKNIKIVYYDMGLNPNQRKQLETHCKICEVRSFPFEKFPAHFKRLTTYAWKPIIIMTLLMEYGWVWWADSSVRYVTSDVDRALTYSKDNSILFFTYGVVFSVAQHTDIQTMEYLKEDRCKFRHFGEVEATFVLFHFDDVTHTIVDTWAACAVNKNCIAPQGTNRKLSCRISNKSDGRCHRFDQAVLSILLRRLYHAKNDYPLVSTPFHIHEIKRGNAISYFPE